MNKLELKITKDIDGNDIDLNAMSVQSAKSFLILVDSLMKIVDNTPDNEGIKINIQKGSACVALEANAVQISVIESDFFDVTNKKSANKNLVKPWKDIHNIISANGLQYEAAIYKNNNKVLITDKIKNNIQSRVSLKKHTEIKQLFIEGKLIGVGGKNPNFHVVTEADETYTVSCTEDVAKVINKNLYNKVYISLWCKNDIKTQCFYSDNYSNSQEFNLYKNFYEEVIFDKHDKSKGCSMILETFDEVLMEKDFNKYQKYLQLFNHNTIDKNYLKTAYLVTKGFKEKIEVKAIFENMSSILNK